MPSGTYPRHRRPTIERFWEKVEISPTIEPITGSRCWLWTAHLNKLGYGGFYDGELRKGILAHRWSYLHFVGPIPSDTPDLDHLCRNPRCVNPAHLEAVTHAENVRRGAAWATNGATTHCRNGHEYTPENTKRIPSHPTWRYCRKCQAEQQRIIRRRKRGHD